MIKEKIKMTLKPQQKETLLNILLKLMPYLEAE